MIRGVCLILIIFMAGCFRLTNAQNQLVVKASPCSFLDPLTPTILTGVEYRFHKRFAVGLDYGLRTPKIKDNDWASEKYNDRYFKLKGEFKVYWHVRKQHRWYSGVGVFYMPESFDHKNGYTITPSVVDVEIIGTPSEDIAVNVYFDNLKISYWFDRDLLETISDRQGTVIPLDGIDKKWTKGQSGQWIEEDIKSIKKWWEFWK